MIFQGAAPALVTPFTSTGEIDRPAFCRLIDRQVSAGSAARVVLGTTRENATISPAERSQLVEFAIVHANGHVSVIIGTGNNSTSEHIAFSRDADRMGADGLLVIGPYYNKPPQAGFRRTLLPSQKLRPVRSFYTTCRGEPHLMPERIQFCVWPRKFLL